MGSKGRPLAAVSHDPRLDGDASRPIGHPASRRTACGAAAAKSASGHLGCPPFEPASAFRGGQSLRDERFAATGAASVANPPEPDAQIIVATHVGFLRDV